MELNLKSDVLTISARGGSVKIKSELPVSDCEDGTVVVSFETFLPSIGIIKSENVTVESKGESLLFSFDDKSVEIDTVNGDVVERIDIENKVPSVELTGKDMDFAKYADLSEAQKKEFLELAEILVACSTKGRNEGLFAIDEMEKIASFTGIVESGKFIEKLHEVAGEEEKKYDFTGRNRRSFGWNTCGKHARLKR